MTIDEHIGVIEDLKSTMIVCMPEPEKTEICASLGEAIETMRKYQKIEEILDQLIDSKIRTYDAVIEIEDIVYGQTEVDDGKDNN